MSTPTDQVVIITLQHQLTAARASGDRVAECEALGNLGIVYYQGEQWQEAIATFTDYLNLAKKLGHQWQEGIAYYYLGYTYRAIGELAQAVDAFCAAYSLSRQFGNQDVFLPVWEQLNESVEVYLSKKEPEFLNRLLPHPAILTSLLGYVYALSFLRDRTREVIRRVGNFGSEHVLCT